MNGTLSGLRQRGFDESAHIPFTKCYRVRCSQCDASAINGLAGHETGCPNQTYECKGCNERLAYKGYCESCR